MNNYLKVDSDKEVPYLDVDAIPLLGGLHEEQIEQLLCYADFRYVASGERVFEQGDMPSNIYILVTGRVDFVVEKNDIYTIETCFEHGDTLGETAFIGIQPQAGSAIVSGVGGAHMIVLCRDALIRIQQECTELFSLLIMNIAREASRKYHKKLSK